MVPNGEYLISNLNKTKELPSNCDKDLTRKKSSFSKWLHIALKSANKERTKKSTFTFISALHQKKRITPFQMTYKQVLQVSITFDYLTKEGMGTILPFTSFLLFNNYFQTSSLEELRSRINNIWWSLYWGKLLNPLEHKSFFRYT